MTSPSGGVPADLVAWPIATTLRTLIRIALNAGLGKRPASCCVIPGRDVAIDDCCAGQAWVRIVRVYPTLPGDFPNPRSTVLGDACDDGGWWGIELGAGTARCAPTQDDHGHAPTDATQEHAAAVLADDAARIRHTILHNLPDATGVEGVVLGEQSHVGPSGGCVGQETLVTVLTQYCQEEQ